jgi:3-isopropylmalate/(R)-2-methylmalate dehydratase small subunit
MLRFESLTGIAVPFGQKNVDTDVIVPARFLKKTIRTGMGKIAFDTLRQRPENLFDVPRNAGAPILIAGDNFGCGSSREHAAWALVDMGFRVVIAPSFADIFAGNAFKNGILLIQLSLEQVDELLKIAGSQSIRIDLPNQRVTSEAGAQFPFEIDPFRKHCLLEGLDEIALTEQLEDEIARYEARIDDTRPWIRGAAARRTA